MAEAMACGLPVISTANTGAYDIVSDAQNGFIVPIQDADAIANKMQWFINNREEIPRMGQNAMKTVSELTWDNYYKQVAAAIGEIIEREKGNCLTGR